MPVIGFWFRQAAWPRGGHLGGNCPERQPVFKKLRFLVTAKRAGGYPMRLFDPFRNAIVMAGAPRLRFPGD
jgi:hypothetical protein